jgi:hypothetical protein
MLTLQTLELLDAANVQPDAPAPGRTPAGTTNVADAGNLGSPAPPTAPKPTSGAIAPPLTFPVLIAQPQAERAGTSRPRRPGDTATVLAPEPKVQPELRASVGDQRTRGFLSVNRPPVVMVAVKALAEQARAGTGVVATTIDQTPAQGAAATSRTPLLVLLGLVAGLGWVFAR